MGNKRAMGDVILSVEQLRKSFGGLVAVDNISFDVERGVILGLAGPNGAGKTVTINLLTGIIQPDSGRVLFKGRDVTRLKPYQRNRLGIGRTYQIVRIFPKMTVLENLLFAMQNKDVRHTLRSIFNMRKNDYYEHVEKAYELLRIVGLEQLAEQEANTLSYGQKKILSFISIIATNPEPELILLDEPMAGLHPSIIEKFTQYIREFNKRGKTFVIVEHNMRVLTSLSSELIVMDKGRIIARGEPSEVRRMQHVIEAYLGRRR